MSAVVDAASAVVHRFRPPSRRVAAILAALLVVFALGALQPAPDGLGARTGQAVVLDNLSTDSANVAARSARLLPTHLPSAPLLPAVAAPPLPATPIVLLAIWTPIWLLSRRSRQAHLLTSAGPGPPSFS
jgi:hypothetical protein